MARIEGLLRFVTNFIDTPGIGSCAPTTAYLKVRRSVDDELIPGTLNVGHALPTLGIGLFAPCPMLVSLLGMNPIAYVVKSLPLQWLYWLVVIVVPYAATLIVRSALMSPR